MITLFWQKTLYRQFVLSLSLIILLPVVIIGKISYDRSVQQLEYQTRKMLEQIVIDTNSQLDKEIRDYTWIANRILISNEIYDFLEKDPGDPYAKLVFSQWIDSMVFKDFFLDKSYVDGIVILADSGVNYIDYRLDGFSSGKIYNNNVLTNLGEKLPSDGKIKILVTGLEENLHNNVGDSKFLVTIGKRIISLKTIRPIGSFFLNLRSSALSEIWDKVDLESGFLWIINEEGIIIHHPNSTNIGKNISNITDWQLVEGGIIEFTDIKPSEKYFSVSNISSYTGWRIIASLPLKQIRHPMANIKSGIIYASLIAFPCTLGIGFVFLSSLIKPIKKLKSRMKEVSKGRWSKLDGKFPSNEIGELIKGFNNMVDKISELVNKVYLSELERKKEEVERKKAEIQALQMQINPHFLFNTFATINAYSEVFDRDSIQEIINSLGSMFRYAILDPMEPVEVQDEINHVKCFLNIQKHRYLYMPAVEWNISGFENYHMLRLTLQPLFENVFKHAFPDGTEPWHKIILSIGKEDECLIISVTDNGIGSSLKVDDMETLLTEGSENRGIGLSNVHRRIRLTYGDNFGIKINGSKGEGTVVKMLLPIIR